MYEEMKKNWEKKIRWAFFILIYVRAVFLLIKKNQIRLKFDSPKGVGVWVDSAFILYLPFWLRLRFEIAFYL
jgi:hypothetical protein